MAEEAGASACVVASNYVLGDMFMRQGKFGEAKIALDRSSSVANAIGSVSSARHSLPWRD